MHRLRRPPALLAALLALVLPLGVALASHRFDDVSSSNPFHADIDAIANAGVTAGCTADDFCPKANVTREQMAAFMNRLGALQAGKPPVVNADRVDGQHATDLAVAGVRSSLAGTVVSWFNHAGAKPTIAKISTGVYHVTIPGRSYNINTNLVASANLVGAPGVAVIGTVSGKIVVSTYDMAGAAMDAQWSLVVHDASTSG